MQHKLLSLYENDTQVNIFAYKMPSSHSLHKAWKKPPLWSETALTTGTWSWWWWTRFTQIIRHGSVRHHIASDCFLPSWVRWTWVVVVVVPASFFLICHETISHYTLLPFIHRTRIIIPRPLTRSLSPITIYIYIHFRYKPSKEKSPKSSHTERVELWPYQSVCSDVHM